MKKLIAVLALAFAPVAAFASSGGVHLEPAQTNVTNQASLQRGAKLFMNYCSSCHSLQYLRYSRLGKDLGLTEAQVMENLNFTGRKYGETITVAMPVAGGEQWFGKAPPDLSLTARSRGVDWIYTYLKSFYVDESRPQGWNNTVLPGASMPHVLWELQGMQHLATEGHGAQAAEGESGAEGHAEGPAFELVSAGTETPQQYDQTVRDITTFLQYAGEPAALDREKYGVWVVLFLAFLTFLLYLLKLEYWRDVH